MVKFIHMISLLNDLLPLNDYQINCVLNKLKKFDFLNKKILILSSKSFYQNFKQVLKLDSEIDFNERKNVTYDYLIVFEKNHLVDNFKFLNLILINYLPNANLISGKAEISNLNYFVKNTYFITLNYTGLYLENLVDILKNIKVEILKDDFESSIKLLEKSDLCFSIFNRKECTNKASFNKVSIIGGSINFLGSTYMAYLSYSAYLLGAGYVNLCIPKEFVKEYLLKEPQACLNPLSSNNGYIVFDKNEIDKIIEISNVIVVGLGLTTNYQTYLITSYLISYFKGTLILDADSLNSLAKYGISCLSNKKGKVILTPHLMEFSRLINVNMDDLRNNQFKYLKEFCDKYHLVINLKSNTTIIYDNQNFYLVKFGTSALAKAGSGDLLDGLIAATYKEDEKAYLNLALANYVLGQASVNCLSYCSISSVNYDCLIKEIRNVVFENTKRLN